MAVEAQRRGIHLGPVQLPENTGKALITATAILGVGLGVKAVIDSQANQPPQTPDKTQDPGVVLPSNMPSLEPTHVLPSGSIATFPPATPEITPSPTPIKTETPKPTQSATPEPTPVPTPKPTEKPTPTPVKTENPKPAEVKINSEGYLTMIPDTDKPYYFIKLVKPTVISDPELQEDGSVIFTVALPGNKISAKNCKEHITNGHNIGKVCKWSGGRFEIKVRPDDTKTPSLDEGDGTWITNASGFGKLGAGPKDALRLVRKGDVLSLINVDPLYNPGDYVSAKDENNNGRDFDAYRRSIGRSTTTKFTFVPGTIGIFSSRN